MGAVGAWWGQPGILPGHLTWGEVSVESVFTPPKNLSQINKQPTQPLLYKKPWQQGEACRGGEARREGREAV